MEFIADRGTLHVEFSTLECEVAADERARVQDALDRIVAASEGLPGRLDMRVIFHPRTQLFHVDARLALPGASLQTGDYDSYFDSALQRGVRKLIRKIEVYRRCPDREALSRSRAVEAMQRRIVAPEDPDAGPLAGAARSGDYAAFRGMLGRYDEWLRDRVGRWVQRYPELDTRIDTEVSIADLVEEVHLNAFERYGERPVHQPLHEWLDSLIDPSGWAFVRDPAGERENISYARSTSGISEGQT